MDDAERLKLIHGPYAAPACKHGDKLFCEARDREVKVGRMSNGLIQWPTVLKTGSPSLIVCGDLALAVRLESEIAISHWWGVGLVTVWKWRKALGVDRTNDGTSRLYREYGPEKLTEDVTAIGRERAREPESIAKMVESKKGQSVHPNTAKALREAASRPWTEDRKRKRSADLIASPHYGENPDHPWWTPEEDAILGTMPDREVAERLGRPLHGVRGRRRSLGIKPYVNKDMPI